MKLYSCVMAVRCFVGMALFTLFSEAPAQTEKSSYREQIGQWQTERIASLKKEDGWLNLAGLFWLKAGENTFGSDAGNALVFPKGEARIGSFIVTSSRVRVSIRPEVPVRIRGKLVTEAVVYESDTAKAPVLELGSLRWFVIKRGERYGVRLRDLESPVLRRFKGIPTYPIDSAWRLEARFETYSSPRQVPITDVTGSTSLQNSPGALVFSQRGQTYRLTALEGGKDQLFIIFADETNGEETYGAGRFVYVKTPGADGKTVLDFNKAYNPPCAFTPYATCPLPPKENFLHFPVTAGEKSVPHAE